jgi:hypothetical protein
MVDGERVQCKWFATTSTLGYCSEEQRVLDGILPWDSCDLVRPIFADDESESEPEWEGNGCYDLNDCASCLSNDQCVMTPGGCEYECWMDASCWALEWYDDI